jgi:hypothetical protein
MSRIDLAYTRHTQGDLAGAEAIYRSMIGDGEDAIPAANNLYVLLRSERRWSDLAQLYRTLAAAIPANGDWAIHLATQLLRHEEYEAGWQWFEARRYVSRNAAVAPALSLPEWTGEPIRRLLVWREQGLGDEIQFARYVALLAQRGIAVTLLCRPALARLFRHVQADVVPLAGSVNLPGPYDAWSLLGSLPLRLGSPYEIPAPLHVSATPRAAGGVGVMTTGSATHGNDANRSMPAEAAARLLSLPGAVSLQPEDTGARDFQDTADIIAGLDFVVSVDTSVAHLAGSMGKPTFVLLPAVRPDWRWLRDRDDSPWYPSVRVLRQAQPGDWNGLIDRVAAEIAPAR